MRCKITNQVIDPFMSFGMMPLANGFIKKNQFKNEFFYKMEIGFSKNLSLFQLNEHPKPENMFNKKYPFYTGSSEFMIKHFKNYSKWIKKKFLQSGSKLIEIGSNDGTFLNNFKNNNVQYLGFEPSKNVFQVAKKNQIKIINNFFNKNNIKKKLVKKFLHNTDVICASNVICHIPDLKNLIESADQLLTSKGVFVFEEPYLGSMFDKISYDQIYDEHVYIFGALSVQKIFSRVGLQLVDAIPQSTHGGSMRYVIMRQNQMEISKGAEQILKSEIDAGLNDVQAYLDFASTCKTRRIEFKELLSKLKSQGANIGGYAATSKSTTVLNYCSIGSDLIQFISDSTLEKQGKFTPGSHIPIISQEEMRLSPPDYLVLFAWNHEKEILAKESALTKQGVKWIRFVPNVEILDI